MLITIITGRIALNKNQGRNKKVTNFCLIGLGLIAVSFLLSFFMVGVPVDYFAEKILVPFLNEIFFSK